MSAMICGDVPVTRGSRSGGSSPARAQSSSNASMKRVGQRADLSPRSRRALDDLVVDVGDVADVA